MSDSFQIQGVNNQLPESDDNNNQSSRRRRKLAFNSLILLLVFGVGLSGGYMMGQQSVHEIIANNEFEPEDKAMVKMHQVNPPDGYEIPAVFGNIGPQLVAAGAIDLTKFINLYNQQNMPLTDDQMTILTKGTKENIVINPENAYFLLNLFWALGLASDNPILTEGPMMSGGTEKVGNFASTGGWTIGAKEPTKLYASVKMFELTEEQQAKLLEVASSVYRPCCNNPTHFPDCNHGMAMLGLLELMVSQNASIEEMFETAKYVTAFWYPQQMLEVATAIEIFKSVNFPEADAKTVVSSQFSSNSGFQAVHQWLSDNGLLEQAPNSGGSCGVK